MRLVSVLCLCSLLAGCGGPEPPLEPPVARRAAPVLYPEELWDAGLEGETWLRIFVSEIGTADTVRVERSSGYAAFDSAAVRAARATLFHPGRRANALVATWVRLPIRFKLDARPGRIFP